MKLTSFMTARTLLLALAGSLSVAPACAQFNSGSTGADGAITLTANTTLQVPPSGIFNVTTFTVPSGVTLSFSPNARNTPIYILAQGDINIQGLIDISGDAGSQRVGGAPGPGGFRGGHGGTNLTTDPPGAGHGPGGGQPGANNDDPDQRFGSGSYAFVGRNVSNKNGMTYGSSLLIPLVGGSGGGGSSDNNGGGGGGGAILIASSTKIDIHNGGIRSWGGNGATNWNDGSGGAIRLVAPVVEGCGSLDVRSFEGGQGRARVDAIHRGTCIDYIPDESGAAGTVMMVFPPNAPKLEFLHAAGTNIPEGTTEAVTLMLSFNDATTQPFRLRATNFKGTVPIQLVLTPENGAPVIVDGQIVMGQNGVGEVTLNAEVPRNSLTRVYAWTR